jgi:hypothetical protein
LSLLDEFVEEGKAVRQFGCPFGVFVYAGVDKFLYEAVLIARVDAEAVSVSL